MCTHIWNTAVAYGIISIGLFVTLSIFMFKYYELKSRQSE